MKRGMVKLEEKFILLIITGVFISFIFLGYTFYNQISDIILNQNVEDAMGIAETAAAAIDGDVFEQIKEQGDAAYQEVFDALDNYGSDRLIKYIYTMKVQDGKAVFVVDTDADSPAEFLEADRRMSIDNPAFHGQVTYDLNKKTNRWGECTCAYAPIYNSDGEVVGIVGCDLNTDNINGVLEDLRTLILSLISVFALVIVISSIWISMQLVSRDALTELPNYDKMIKDGNYLYKKNKLSRYSAVMYEIHDQKFINQKLGAVNGDNLIKEYAKGQKKRMKRGDRLYSISNGRFFALIKKEREQLFLDAIRKVDVTVRGKDGVMPMEIEFNCGVFQIRATDQIQDIHNYCSLALEESAKQAVVNTRWFEESMIEQMVSEREVINSFRTGLTRHEFVVYYQPKVNLDDNRLCGAEALVRWFKNGKIVPPDSFIPILEKNNLVTDLDFYVFEQVCKDISAWVSEGYQVVKISSNFSKLHLKNPYFAEDLMDIISKYQVNTDYIEVELTESSGYYNFKALGDFVDRMNQEHISVSIDDFGTGYSSLSLLKDLDFDVVKMDKSFFRDLEKGDHVNEKMVENVIKMVHDLDRDVISEGIETKQQALFLKKLQAPVVQGYLYDKPLPHNEFEKRLKNPVYSGRVD